MKFKTVRLEKNMRIFISMNENSTEDNLVISTIYFILSKTESH